MQFSHYLFFTTHCEQALQFYTDCGLGRVTSVLRHGDRGLPVRTEGLRGKVMHALFEGPGLRFYASDNDDAEPMRGFAMYCMPESRAQTLQLFERMAVGGQITTPLGMQPWGSYFGKLTDVFGVQWMFDCTASE